MSKEILLDKNVYNVEKNLNKWLNKNFDFVYKYNGFYIVANNDTPMHTLLNKTGKDIWLEMIKSVKNIMITENSIISKEFYRKLKVNFILGYGTTEFLSQAYEVLFVNFGRKLIPINNSDMLYFTYTNNDIFIQKLDNITWKPIGPNNTYNKIIEVVIKLVFDTLEIMYNKFWTYKKKGNIYNILQRDIDLGYSIPDYYTNEKKIKNYLYQIWLIYIHNKTNILSNNQKKIIKLFNSYKTLIPSKIEQNILDVSKLYRHTEDIIPEEIIEDNKIYIYLGIGVIVIIIIAFIYFMIKRK